MQTAHGAALLVLAFVLAGCGAPPTGPDGCDQPSWILGKNSITVQNSWGRTGVRTDAEKEDRLGEGSLTFLDHPLDRIEMDFHWQDRPDRTSFRGIIAEQGTLTLTLEDAEGRPLQAFRNASTQRETSWSWTDTYDANFTLTVELQEPLGTPDPRPVVAKWRFDGIPQDPTAPGDIAVAWYDAEYWYRSCTP